MIREVTAGGGNLLLNIGPLPDGSIPRLADERLRLVGRWLSAYGQVVYGAVDRVKGMENWLATGSWTRRGHSMFYWVTRWPGRELAIGGLKVRVRKAVLLSDGRELRCVQTRDRLIIRGLPEKCPDRIAGISVLRLDLAGEPRQVLGTGCVVL
jgi:alpha-L-fucosidase